MERREPVSFCFFFMCSLHLSRFANFNKLALVFIFFRTVGRARFKNNAAKWKEQQQDESLIMELELQIAMAKGHLESQKRYFLNDLWLLSINVREGLVAYITRSFRTGFFALCNRVAKSQLRI